MRRFFWPLLVLGCALVSFALALVWLRLLLADVELENGVWATVIGVELSPRMNWIAALAAVAGTALFVIAKRFR